MSLLLLFHGATTPPVQQNSGGFIHEPHHIGRFGWSEEDYKRVKREVDEEIAPPPKAAKAIQKVAAKAVQRASQIDGPGLFETILKDREQAASDLRQAMRKAKVAYDEAYVQAMLVEAWVLIAKQQQIAEDDREFEQIALLMMEL